MLEKGKVSGRQLEWLLIMSMLPTVMLILPSALAPYAKQDSWLAIIIIGIIGLLTGYIVVLLGNKFPNKTIIGYSPLIVGKFLSKIVSLIYILFFIHITAVIIREFGEVLNVTFLKNTPLEIILISTILVLASAVRNGIEVISRVNELILPVMIGIIIIIYFLILPDLNFAKLKPVLANGIMPILKGAYPTSLFLTETFVLITILPAINKSKEALSSTFKAVLIVTFLGLIMMVEIVALYGGDQSATLQYPMLSLVQYISLFGFVENIDALIVVMWIGGGFIKIAIFYYCLVINIAETFKLKSYKSVVLPTGIILITFSLMLFENITQLGTIVTEILPPYYLVLKIGIPLLLLMIATFRGSKESKHN
ncbi:GerAB/ArcD/ProY family transporter [Selenihalanaerobacter shriftii]|uniref:Spore germination protein KB n=1 Tax=Selenihalanaerobacter shriftii TaxID=142842 RepID=A0A1T4LW41_9FIRM|nr:endospore germination permease [Selenihalanaerobacter shriftii]SJZ58851.1 spore germination protein KB [Selenihalanaerobacter shriftii]